MTREQRRQQRRETVRDWVVFIAILVVAAGLPNWWA